LLKIDYHINHHFN